MDYLHTETEWLYGNPSGSADRVIIPSIGVTYLLNKKRMTIRL
jgi:hypothetical protein